MQRDFNKSAAAMVAGTEKAIAAAVGPLLKRIEELEARKPEIDVGQLEKIVQPEVTRAVAALPIPRSVTGQVIDRAGHAILTFSDGTTADIGPVVGRDGADADMSVLEDKLREMVDAIPKPKDGKDGFSLTDFDVNVEPDGRTIVMSFEDETQRFEVEMKFPIPLDRGVYKAGDEYEAGDGVSFGGHYWIAQRKTSDKPDGADSGWRMAVRRGRDGKDAK